MSANCSLFSYKSKNFFYLPEEVRAEPGLIRPEPGDKYFVARGYSPIGREKLSQAVDNGELESLRAVPDVKDMFEMGPDRGVPEQREPNRYPPKNEIPGFEEFTKDFYWDAHNLSMNVLRSIAIGLGLDEDYFVSCHQDADNLFRLIRYPAIERSSLVEGSSARTSPHTDYGSITLLFQDDVGGLEVEDPKKPGTYRKLAPFTKEHLALMMLRYS